VLDELRRVALFTSGVAELTRHRAEQIVKGWVKEGEVRKDNAAGMVKSLMEVSRNSRQELVAFVRSEIRAQLEAIGVATKRDLERLDRRVTRLEKGTQKTTARTPRKKTTPKRPSQSDKGN
jgi:polyhydroxyalkanoate synthesis regulator phasin